MGSEAPRIPRGVIRDRVRDRDRDRVLVGSVGKNLRAEQTLGPQHQGYSEGQKSRTGRLMGGGDGRFEGRRLAYRGAAHGQGERGNPEEDLDTG